MSVYDRHPVKWGCAVIVGVLILDAFLLAAGVWIVVSVLQWMGVL